MSETMPILGIAEPFFDPESCLELKALEMVTHPAFLLELIDRHEPDVFRCIWVNESLRRAMWSADTELQAGECLPMGSILLAGQYIKTAIASGEPVTFQDRFMFPGSVYDISVRPLVDRHGSCRQVVGFGHDVTDQVETLERLTFLEQNDPLTGLPNREQFMARLQEGIKILRDPDERTALLMIDLDHFGLINREYGHSAGDEVIKRVAARLGKIICYEDTLSRFGDDEFAIVCPNVSEDDVKFVANEVLDSFNGYEIGDPIVKASIGVATTGHQEYSPEALLSAASLALSFAKASGRRRIEIFDPALRGEYESRLNRRLE